MKKSIASLAVLITAGSAAAAAGAATPAHIADCLGHQQVRPSSLVLFCGDANQALTHLRWRHWGAAEATAGAVEITNGCNPDCADGHPISKRVSVTASGLRRGRYTQLTVGRRHFTLTATGPVLA